MVVLIFFAFAHTQVRKGHIAVDVITQALPEKGKDILNAFTLLIATGMIGMVTYAQYLQTLEFYRNGLTTAVLYIPVVPFMFGFYGGWASSAWFSSLT